MKEKFELIGTGNSAHLIRKFKRHWWSKWEIEMDGTTPKIYLVDQDNCEHRLKYAYTGRALPNYMPVPIYRCEKCGYEQVGTTHLQGNKYED